MIELPIKHPELFESLGVAQPKVGAIALLPKERAVLPFCARPPMPPCIVLLTC